MIGLEQLNSHPASQVALQALQTMGQPVDKRQLYLIQMASDWINSEEENPAMAFPWPGFLPDLRDEAAHLATLDSVAWVASLFVPNLDEMEEQFQANDHPGTTWPILKEQLDELNSQLRQSQNPNEVGRQLAENLYQNLRDSLVGFGHPNGSTRSL